MNQQESTNLKVNTGMTVAGTIIMICLAVIGWLAVDKISTLTSAIKDLTEKVVPRSEHQARWTEENARFLRLEMDVADVRTRIVRIELEQAKNNH